MSLEIITTLEAAFASMGVPMYLFGIVILICFFIGFLILGLDVKYAVAFVSPAVIGFASVGWFPIWIATLMWIFIAGMGLFLLYSLFGNM
jgi:hypothetical protein